MTTTQAADPALSFSAQAPAGNRVAFGDIYRQHRAFIADYIQRRVPDWHAAQDLTADTFEKAFARIDGFEPRGGGIRAWLVTIARNLITDRARSATYRLVRAHGDLSPLDQHASGPDGHPDQTALAAVLSGPVLAAIAQLPEAQRECLVLRFLLRYSTAETATLMSHTTKGVASLQYRATRSVRRHLTEDFAADVLT